MASTEAVGAPHHDPLLGLDVARLEAEMEKLYLKERTIIRLILTVMDQ